MKEKHYDIRTRNRYLKKGTITEKDVKTFIDALPNDEDNFELSMLDDEDEFALGDTLSEEELQAMPEITEADIDNFDFLENKESQSDSENSFEAASQESDDTSFSKE